MPTVHSAHFGEVEFAENSVVEFPLGLPAFDTERKFVVLNAPEYQPLVFLQSLATPALSFLAIDVHNVTLGYSLELAPEDMEALGGVQSESDLEILALVAVAPSGEVSANLQAPLVIHRHSRCAVQAIQSVAAYSCRHPLGHNPPACGEAPCL